MTAWLGIPHVPSLSMSGPWCSDQGYLKRISEMFPAQNKELVNVCKASKGNDSYKLIHNCSLLFRIRIWKFCGRNSSDILGKYPWVQTITIRWQPLPGHSAPVCLIWPEGFPPPSLSLRYTPNIIFTTSVAPQRLDSFNGVKYQDKTGGQISFSFVVGNCSLILKSFCGLKDKR